MDKELNKLRENTWKTEYQQKKILQKGSKQKFWSGNIQQQMPTKSLYENDNRFHEAEEWINEVEERVVEITTMEKNKDWK